MVFVSCGHLWYRFELYRMYLLARNIFLIKVYLSFRIIKLYALELFVCTIVGSTLVSVSGCNMLPFR